MGSGSPPEVNGAAPGLFGSSRTPSGGTRDGLLRGSHCHSRSNVTLVSASGVFRAASWGPQDAMLDTLRLSATRCGYEALSLWHLLACFGCHVE